MKDDPIRQLLDRAGGGYRPKAADYDALPLRPGAAAEVQAVIAKTASSVQLLRRTGEYAAARRLCRVTAGDLARHLDPDQAGTPSPGVGTPTVPSYRLGTCTDLKARDLELRASTGRPDHE